MPPKRLDILGLPEDEHLIQIKNRLTGENIWKRFIMQGHQTFWLKRETRRNLYYIYKFIYDLDRQRGKRSFHCIQTVQKGIGFKDDHYVRSLLIILCWMKNNPLKWIAYRSYAQNRKKPKIIQRIVRA